MSIQPLFNGPLLLPSRQLVDASKTGASTTSDNASPSVDGGLSTGDNALDGKASDFLDPKDIQDMTNDFSDSLDGSDGLRGPVSNELLVQLIDGQISLKNPDPIDIMNLTNKGINIATAPGIGSGIGPGSNSNPLTWSNPSALDIFVGVSAATSGLAVGNPTPNQPDRPTTPETPNIIGTVGNNPVMTPTNTSANNLLPRKSLNNQNLSSTSMDRSWQFYNAVMGTIPYLSPTQSFAASLQSVPFQSLWSSGALPSATSNALLSQNTFTSQNLTPTLSGNQIQPATVPRPSDVVQVAF